MLDLYAILALEQTCLYTPSVSLIPFLKNSIRVYLKYFDWQQFVSRTYIDHWMSGVQLESDPVNPNN